MTDYWHGKNILRKMNIIFGLPVFGNKIVFRFEFFDEFRLEEQRLNFGLN
jgi:hypothetical protein